MSDVQAGRDEILRDLQRAAINLEGLLIKGEELPDLANLEFALIALGCVIDYVKDKDE